MATLALVPNRVSANTRPTTRDDAWFNAQADEHFAEVVEHPGDRAKFIQMMKDFDKPFARAAKACATNDALIAELTGDAPVSEARLREIEAMYPENSFSPPLVKLTAEEHAAFAAIFGDLAFQLKELAA
jgi:hypothetical protein